MFFEFSFVTIWALLWGLLLAVCAYAYFRGNTAERIGAVVILGVCAVAALHDGLMATIAKSLDNRHILLARLASDGALAIGFLVLAIRFASLWLGAAMLFQAFLFTLQATYFVLGRMHDAFYATANNVAFAGILMALALGTWGADRKRRATQARLTPNSAA